MTKKTKLARVLVNATGIDQAVRYSLGSEHPDDFTIDREVVVPALGEATIEYGPGDNLTLQLPGGVSVRTDEETTR